MPQIVGLENVLLYGPYACEQVRDEDAWRPAEFAWYASGVLTSMGYRSLVVGDGQPEGRTWILVEIDVGSRGAWVPVDPVPAAGSRQTLLGAVAWSSNGTGAFSFDSAYTQAAAVLSAGENRPPTASIYPPRPPVREDMELRFRAMSSTDLDGTIIRYVWDFGDGLVTGTTAESIYHVYVDPAAYDVTLTVVDDQGGVGRLTRRLVVHAEDFHCAACGY